MTTQISALWVIAGLGALAGLFFLLQRLRVRQRAVTVETTLFWRRAVEEARARVFVQRFRHPWVYALLVAIAALLWLGFAGLEFDGSDQRRHVVLLDASAGMARGQRFAETVDLIESYVEGLRAESRSIVMCAGRPQTLLRPGEHLRLLRERLAEARPEGCPASVERTIRQLLAGRGDAEEWTICIAGDAAVSEAAMSALPPGVELVRLAPPTSETASNAGIVALGAAPAASGTWDRLDVLVATRASTGPAPTPRLEIAGRPWSAAPETSGSGSRAQWIYRDLPARGEILEVRIASGGDLALDDAAQLILPDRTPLRVLADPGLPPILRRALEADPAVVLVDGDARVAVRRAGSDVGRELPAFEVVDEEAQEDAILIIHPESQDATEVLAELHERLGLSEIDASDLARARGGAVTMGASPGAGRRLQVWDTLLGEDFNFVQSRSFPLFVALSLRWLASFQEWPESAAVGEPLALNGETVRDEQGNETTTLGDHFRPTHTGVYATASGVRFAAALLDPGTVEIPADAAVLDAAASTRGGPSLVSLLLLLAMVLLVVEWILYGLGRIP